jgi:Uma2 family endonuclease
MTIAEREQLAASGAEPTERRWTRAEYLALGEQGYFEGQRVQLLDGKVYVMAPQGDAHNAGVELVTEALRAAFGSGYRVRQQLPVVIDEWSEPEPDVSVVPGVARDAARQGKPRSGVLFVEVADTTLRFDRGSKSAAYARTGVQDYWIVCIPERVVEVRRQPGPGEYQSITVYKAGERIAPLAKPDAVVAVDDLLP